MTRLPTPGGDTGNWGTILNEYLLTAHSDDGSLKSGIVAGGNIADGAVTTDALADASVTMDKLASSLQTTLSSVVASSMIGKAGGIASLDSSGKVPASQLPVMNSDGTVIPDASASTKGNIQLAGDLSGSASSPKVVGINGVAVSGTPSAGQALVATGAASAGWSTVDGGGDTITPIAGTATIWNSTTAPTSPQTGDFWVDSTTETGKVHAKTYVNSQWVSIGSADVVVDPDPDPTTPDAPTNAAQSDLTDTSVVLSWTAPSAVVDGYNIYNGTTKLNTALVTDTTYTVTGLDAGTDYTFTIRSVSGTTESSTGAAIAVKTTGETDPDPDPTTPDAPTNVTATAGDGEATISFDGSAGATSYTVTSSPGGITATGTTPPITVSGLTNGTEYTFTVTASNAAGTSDASAASGGVVPVGVEPSPDSVFPLKLSSDGRHFVGQNNEQFMVVADTCWSMMTKLSLDDIKWVIDTRAGQGFNVIMTNIAAFKRTESGPRGTAFVNGDVTNWNESYMQGIDDAIAYAKTKNMVIMLNGIWMADNGGWADSNWGNDGNTPSAADMETFGQKVGTRFGVHTNVIFFVGGDEQADSEGNNPNMLPAIKAYASGLKSTTPSRLLTYHPRWNSYDDTADESWLDFNSYQHNDNTGDSLNYFTSTGPAGKPIFCIEPSYDPSTAAGDVDTTPILHRINQWGSILAGAVGVSHGGPRAAWFAGESGSLDKSAFTREIPPMTGHVNTILSQYPWQKLKVDNSIVDGGGTARDNKYGAVSADGTLMVVYTPSGGVTVDGGKLSGVGLAQWYNPATGQASGSSVAVSNSTGQTLSNPLSQDAVVVITAGTSAPLTPLNVSPMPGDNQVTVSFSLSTGATSYTAETSSGQTATGSTSPIVISSLTSGLPVTVTVVAKNSTGVSAPSSPSAAVIPTEGGLATVFLNDNSYIPVWQGSSQFDGAALIGAIATTIENADVYASYTNAFPADKFTQGFQQMARNVCSILYSKSADVPIAHSTLTLLFRGTGLASASKESSSIEFGTGSSGAAVTASYTTHEVVHLFQYGREYSTNVYARGVIEGIADYVLVKMGYHTVAGQRPAGGGTNWYDGYDTTAFFFDYIESRASVPSPDFVKKLNYEIRPDHPDFTSTPWSPSVIQSINAQNKTVEQLWADYKTWIAAQ